MAAARPARRPGLESASIEFAPSVDPRRAETLADEITRDIVATGWTEGRVLGPEHELLQRYNVSRGVFRQAVQLLEHHGVARMQTGRNGGLVVTRPDGSVLAKALAVYLEAEQTTYLQLLATRTIVEEATARLAAERVRQGLVAPGEIEQLRFAVADESSRVLQQETSRQRSDPSVSPHVAIARCTGNPLLVILAEAFARLAAVGAQQAVLGRRVKGTRVGDVLRADHGAIVEAIAAGDADGAVRLMRDHLEAMATAVS